MLFSTLGNLYLFCPHSLFGFLHARTCRKTGKDIHKGELSEVINPKSIWVSYRGVRSHVQAVHQSPARPERKQQSGERVGKQAIVAFIMFSTLFFGPDNQDTMFDGQRIVASSKSKRGFTSSPVQITEKITENGFHLVFFASCPSGSGAEVERRDTGGKERYRTSRLSGISFAEKSAINQETDHFELDVSHNFSVIFP